MGEILNFRTNNSSEGFFLKKNIMSLFVLWGFFWFETLFNKSISSLFSFSSLLFFAFCLFFCLRVGVHVVSVVWSVVCAVWCGTLKNPRVDFSHPSQHIQLMVTNV